MIYLNYILSNWFFIIAVILITINALYVFSTQFTKRITVKKKYTYGSRRARGSQQISDNDNNIYTVTNSFLMFHFTSAELFNKLDKGRTYDVSGYGVRIPFLGMFPNITSIN